MNIGNSPRSIMTIGYEGASIDQFLAALLSAGIENLVDVRELPLSRKAGFSKTRLREVLYSIGIKYTHLRPLGDPKAGRQAARAGNYREFLKIYSARLEERDAQEALEYLTALCETERCCLLCYEADAAACHRKIVAERIAQQSATEIMHLATPARLAAQSSYAVGASP
jgi:uncharacterized protein (DUF488 family)